VVAIMVPVKAIQAMVLQERCATSVARKGIKKQDVSRSFPKLRPGTRKRP
jgi:hypothetical protein